MKKMVIILLILLLTLSLCACTEKTPTQTVYTIAKGGKTFEVDTVNHTIFDGTHTYKYTFSGDSDDYDIEITYPDGSTYYTEKSGFLSIGGWSLDYDEDRYVDGAILCSAILEKAPEPPDPSKAPMVFVAILILGMGIFSVASPHTVWYWEYGWRFKDAEPSDLALTLNQLGGYLGIITAIIMIIFLLGS